MEPTMPRLIHRGRFISGVFAHPVRVCSCWVCTLTKGDHRFVARIASIIMVSWNRTIKLPTEARRFIRRIPSSQTGGWLIETRRCGGAVFAESSIL
jgi:hypothetical protein